MSDLDTITVYNLFSLLHQEYMRKWEHYTSFFMPAMMFTAAPRAFASLLPRPIADFFEVPGRMVEMHMNAIMSHPPIPPVFTRELEDGRKVVVYGDTAGLVGGGAVSIRSAKELASLLKKEVVKA